MNKLAVFPLCLSCLFVATTSPAMDLKQSKVTQVVNDVQIISAADQKEKAATVNDLFNMPDILRTGPASRAELIAADDTVTRVGANTIFSFDPANRSIDLKQGSLLFHSPHGKGGGTIHTGSATASVLGTTLIIVTTENGGMKVIALEGEVEVKFHNGLKQKLDPGQMTFVLPGANQLAPVIVFRLDELTQNSLLVKGFNQTLASLPLIQNQINQQLKLIAAGKFSDTGLDVGENATRNQVEVLDLNTISGEQHTQPPPPPTPAPTPPNSPPPLPPPPAAPSLSAAEAADATINQSSLMDASIPTPPIHVIVGQPFPLAANSYFNGQTFSGFVARNISVNTAPGDSPLSVDLSPYANQSTFDFVALNNFSIEGSVIFSGLATADNLALIAGNQFILTPGISITANTHNLTLSSPAALTFDNVGLYNNGLDINLDSGDAITFKNNSTITAGGRLIVNAANGISATDSHLTGASALLTTLNGNISFENSILDAGNHALLESPSSISLDSSTINGDYVSLVGTATTAITVNNSTINAPNSIIISSINDLNVTGSSPAPQVGSQHSVDGGGSSLNTDPNTGSVTLSSASGSVNVSGTSITAHYLTLNSGDGILLDGSGQTLTAAGAGSTANLTAANLITVNNTDFSAFAVVNMAANTINLLDVAFGSGSAVTLRSLYGVLAPNPNTGAASVQGDVNFISGVTYGGDPAQNHIGSGITIGTLH